MTSGCVFVAHTTKVVTFRRRSRHPEKVASITRQDKEMLGLDLIHLV